MLTTLLLILILFVLILLVFLVFISKNNSPLKQVIEQSIQTEQQKLDTNFKDEFQRNRQEITQSIAINRKEQTESLQKNRTELSESLHSFEQKSSSQSQKLNEAINNQFNQFGQQQSDQNQNFLKNIQHLTDTIGNQLKIIREDNTKQLNEMRKTVDEKLQSTLEKRLGESFKLVQDQLESVQKGLGEMQNLATDVGGLKRVLSGVKNRGIIGEYQLENILEQILTPHQYEKQYAIKKGSRNAVDFAIKFPGQNQNEEVYLPIDSKFPLDDYERLLEAYELADKEKINSLHNALCKSIDKFAKDISDKYLDPPYTTSFGILFLPIEGLYAEVVRNTELFEKLQRTYKITIAGPTTMATMLNSFKMGFNTIVMNKKSSEVWKVLDSVKTEFSTFGGMLDTMDKQLNTASNTLSKIKTTRMSAMERKLREVSGDASDQLEASTEDLSDNTKAQGNLLDNE